MTTNKKIAENKEEKLRGFAVIINSILGPLNKNIKFQREFKNVDAKILLNIPNLNNAVMIIIFHGSVKIKSIPNKPKTNLKKKNIGWNAFLEINSQTFLTLAISKISLLKVTKLWISRKIKIRGIKKLLLLLKMLRILIEHSEFKIGN
ncbi:MAG: hypothetical protein ACFFE4_08330 [Candidatus Thorarchaeota archaeon]